MESGKIQRDLLIIWSDSQFSENHYLQELVFEKFKYQKK